MNGSAWGRTEQGLNDELASAHSTGQSGVAHYEARLSMRARRESFCALAGAIAGVAMIAGAPASSVAISATTVSGAHPWQALYGVAIRPDGSIYIVGSKGLLMVSDDQGKSWNEQVLHERDGNVLFQDRDLYAIQFTPDGKSGWIAGEMGIVLHSEDSGKTWTRQQTGVESNLFNVSAVDAQHAYACGAEGVLVSTVDGGQHWNVYKYKDPIIFFDVHYTDPNSGWMVGEFETILHTTDGGKTWNVSHGGNTGDYTVGPSFLDRLQRSPARSGYRVKWRGPDYRGRRQDLGGEETARDGRDLRGGRGR